MEAENFVVKGAFFVSKPKDIDEAKLFKTLRDAIIEYMISKGYIYTGPPTFLYTFSELEFRLHRAEKPSFVDKIKKTLNRDKYESNKYYRSLISTRDDIPWIVKVYMYFGKFKEIDGIILEILSEPAIFYKIAQLKLNIVLDSKDYSYIIYTNRVFVEGIAKSIQAFTIKAPAPLTTYVKTVISDKLREFNFIEESKLLEKGRKRIEIGEIENGLMDLRVAMERFFYNLVKNKTDLEPAPQDKIKANIEKLEKANYLDKEFKGFLVAISERIYKILSNQPAHKREPVMEQYSLFEARLLFDLVGDIFNYFIEKIIKYNMKTKCS